MSQRATNSREPSGAEARAAADERSAAEAASSLLASVTPARLALLSHSQLVDVVADLLAMARRSERMRDEKLDTAVHKMAQRKRAGVGSARGSRLEAMRKQAEADKKWIEKHRARTQRILNEQRRDEAATTIQRFMRNRMAAANPPT